MTRALALVVATLLVIAFLALSASHKEPEERVEARATTTTVWPQESIPDLGEHFDQLVVAMKPKPAPKARTAPTHHYTGTSIWDAIANCESGGRWDDTRGGYEGGLHFAHDTWVRAGGRKYAEHAYQATREQQIEIAVSWLARTSWAQWPVCSRKVGAR